jgi:hypothetical protein
MKDKAKQNCNNCVHKAVCFERANIEDIDGKESEAMKSWEEYVKQYGCQYYQPKLPKDSVVLSREEYDKLQTDMRRLTYQNCNLTIENKNLKEDFNIEILKGKETAEKILKDLKLLVPDNALGIVTRYFKEIIGVEIKE